jgi:hypothetical protein
MESGDRALASRKTTTDNAATINPYTSVATMSGTAFLLNLFHAHENASPMSTCWPAP